MRWARFVSPGTDEALGGEINCPGHTGSGAEFEPNVAGVLEQKRARPQWVGAERCRSNQD